MDPNTQERKTISNTAGDANGERQHQVGPTNAREVADPDEVTGKCRVCCQAAMLTYNGIAGLDQWHRFADFVQSSLSAWRVKHWGWKLAQTNKQRNNYTLMAKDPKQ